MTEKKADTAQTGRRQFLKLAGVSAPAALAATVAPQEAAAEVAETAGEGLRSTPHVEAYLKSARF